MVLLVDTNIILDFIMKREPFYDAANEIMNKCRSGEITGYIALPSVTTIWYLLRKVPDAKRRQILMDISRLLTVASVGHSEVIRAIQMVDFPDFEDCIQDRCAEAVHANYIVTRNIKDFTCSEIQAILPEELLERMQSEKHII